MNKRPLAILITAMLLAPSLALILTMESKLVEASPDVSDNYDFKDNENNLGWEYMPVGTDYTMDLNPNQVASTATAATQANYDAAENSDDSRWTTSGDVGDEEEQYYRFYIGENVSTIDNIVVTWEGYGDTGEGYEAYAYIWDISTMSWKQIAYNSSTEATFTWENHDNIEAYIDENNHIWVASTSIMAAAGSCPNLYIWNGDNYEFINDTSPAGAIGYSVPPKIAYSINRPVDYTVMKDVNEGKFVIANDLYEIDYIDELEIWEVYHPIGTELYAGVPIWTDVEPFSDVDYRDVIHTVTNPEPPVGAWDEHGNDISSLISEPDGVYVNRGELDKYNIITLDFGDLGNAKQIKLLVKANTYWIVPSPDGVCSFIEVPDEDGNWVRAEWRTNSFPEFSRINARTYVIDITNWFLTDNYMLRINDWHMKAYDYIAIDTSVDKYSVVKKLIPTEAELFKKGISRMTYDAGHGGYFDYYQTRPPENYYTGNFTRYGDVLSLLEDSDDIFVIMHPGDAIELEFNQDSNPQGKSLTKDYVLMTDVFYKEEWVKYLLENSWNTVEPLPFHAMSYYPYPENEEFPWDDEHLEWWGEYQTRYIEPNTDSHRTLYTDYVGMEVYYTLAAWNLIETWTGTVDAYAILPTQPILLNPDNDSIIYDNTPAFNWVEGSNADNHKLRVDNDSDFSSPEVEENGLAVTTFTIADDNALVDGTYWWSVTAINENGENASDNYTFTLMTSAPFTFGWEENGENSKNISYATGETSASVHSLCGEEAGNENIYAIDNDVETFWIHAPQTPENHWIIFDLGENRTVTQLQIYNTVQINFGYVGGMTVYVSENTVDWGDNVWEGTLKKTPAGWKSTGSFSKLGQFIRLVSKNDSDDPEGINEIKFYVDWPPSRRILGSKFKIKHIEGLADNITAYFQTGENYPENMMAAIYSTGGGLIGQTNQMTFDNSVDENWRTFSFPSDNRPTLSRNTDYILVLWGNGDIYFAYEENASGPGYYVDENYALQFPSSVTFISDGNKQFSIYASVSYSGGLPEDPFRSQPWNGETITDNTPPLETSKGSPWENTNEFRFLVDNDSDMSSPWIDVLVEPNWEQPYTALYYVQDNEALVPGTWYWKPIPKNPLYEKLNVPTEWFKIPGDANVTTQDATSITSTQATLNASITYTDVADVDAHFQYKWKPEDWVLENYVLPTDPATAGNWGNRTPVLYVTVSGHENENDDNTYVCDGTFDEVEIQKAIENLYENYDGGKVFLYDGTYNIHLNIQMKSDISLVGESRDNTILRQTDYAGYFIHGYGASNVLIENIHIWGKDSTNQYETMGIDFSIWKTQNAVVKNVLAHGFSYSAFATEAWFEANIPHNNIWFINVEAYDTAGPGIMILNTENFYIDNSYFHDVGHGLGYFNEFAGGIAIWDSKKGRVVNNTIENSGGDGIWIQRMNFPTLGSYGNVEDILIQSNSIENVGTYEPWSKGIWLYGAVNYEIDNVIMRNNRFIENRENYYWYGVYFANSYVENCVVDNNDFFYVENAWVEQGSGHIIENNVGATYDNTVLETTSLTSYSKVLTGLETERTYGFRGRIWFDGSSDDGLFEYFSTTARQWNQIENWTGTIEGKNYPPSIENLYITDTDNVATDNLTPQTEYRFNVEIEDNETLADIENVTLVVYLDNENLPDNEGDHYTFRWVRDREEISANLVGTSSTNIGTLFSYQRLTFYAAGLYWAFYSDGSNMVYKTSSDGSSWSSENTIRSATNGKEFSITFDGTFMHYAYGNDDGESALYYRRGVPNSNGTITWSAAEQTLDDNGTYPSIAVVGGYPWVSYSKIVNDPFKRPYVIKSSTDNGTWTTAENFPYELSSSVLVGWYTAIGVLTDNKVYVYYAKGNPTRGYGKLWDGTSWGQEENIYSSPGGYSECFSLIAFGDDVFILYLNWNDENLYFKKRTYGAGWENDENLSSVVSNSASASLTLDNSTGDFHAFYQTGDNWIRYKKYTASTEMWDETPLEFYYENEGADYNDFFSTFEQVQNDMVGIIWTSKTLSPWNVKFAALGTGNWLSSPSSYIITENCVAGDNTKTVDNFIFAIELDANAQIAENWDVWVQVYDSAGNQDNRFFLNRFDVVSAAEWNLISTWTGTLEAPAVWDLLETWTNTVEAPVQWNLIESWDGIIGVQAPAEWQLVESWSGTIETPVGWSLVEQWTGIVQAPSAWNLIEQWDGTVEAPAGWQLVESWSGAVEAPASWNLVEEWTGTVQTPTEWQLIETWSGTVQSPSEWSLIETWSGTTEAPAAWELAETWMGTIQAPTAWNLVESWDGTIQAPAEWDLIETWGGTAEAPTAWGLIETWSGTIEAPVGWNLIETWTGTVEAFSGWSLLETWTGTVEAFSGWQLLETWTGTAENPAVWDLIETWSATVRAPAEWQLIETWDGGVQAPSAWDLVETWSGTVQAPTAWVQIESWSGTVLAYAEWSEIETWTGAIQAPTAWNLIESWTGTIEAFVSWELISTWGGTVQAPSAWDLIESWTGTVQAPSEWSEIGNWSGTVIAVGWQLIESWVGTARAPGFILIESWTGGIETPAVYAVSISITPDNQSGTLGDTLTYTVIVTNIGGTIDNYDLASSDAQGWAVYLNDSALLNVASGASDDTTLNVGLSTTGTHTIIVTATSQTDGSVSDSDNCTTISATAPDVVPLGDGDLALAIGLMAIGIAFCAPFIALVLVRKKRREEEALRHPQTS